MPPLLLTLPFSKKEQMLQSYENMPDCFLRTFALYVPLFKISHYATVYTKYPFLISQDRLRLYISFVWIKHDFLWTVQISFFDLTRSCSVLGGSILFKTFNYVWKWKQSTNTHRIGKCDVIIAMVMLTKISSDNAMLPLLSHTALE